MAYNLAEGYYYIRNTASRTVVDLSGGSQADGTKVQGWSHAPRNDVAFFNQLWSVHKAPGSQYYLIQNVRGGTVWELEKGGQDDDTKVLGCIWKGTASKEQCWFFTGDNADCLEWVSSFSFRFILTCDRIHNAKGHLLADMFEGLHDNGTPVVGWHKDPNRAQQWAFHRVDMVDAPVV